MAMTSGDRPICASYSANEKCGTKSMLFPHGGGPVGNGRIVRSGATEYTLNTPERARISYASRVSPLSEPRGPDTTTAIFFVGSGAAGAGSAPENAGGSPGS